MQSTIKLLVLSVIEASGRNGVGILLKGFNLKTVAIATSFAHDSHNLTVVEAIMMQI